MRNEALQKICRSYLAKTKYLAKKHGLLDFVNDIIIQNRKGNCSATEHEVQMLSRMVDDDRIARTDIPPLLNKNYRQSIHDEDFEHIEKLPYVGTYSKVSALLYASKKREKQKENLKKT